MSDVVSKSLKRLNNIISETDALYHEASFRLGISDSACMILYSICLSGRSCPLSRIVKSTGLNKQTVNSALRKLEKDGMVYLEAADGRSKIVCLTDDGVLLASRTAGKIIEIENEILSSWPEEDIRRYFELSERFLEDLGRKMAELRNQ